MVIGELYRVVRNNFKTMQLGDLVIITKEVGIAYVEGMNLRTNTRHHYLKVELEKLCQHTE